MAYDLVPKPKKMRAAAGGFAADMSTVVHVSSRSGAAGEFLAESAYFRTSFTLWGSFEKSADHCMWVSRTEEPSAVIAGAKRALEAAGKSREAYGLAVTSRGLAVAARGPAGLMCGAATAAQLLTKKDGRPFWPACTISDWPDLELRAVHLDLKHHMEKLDYLGRLIPRLASFKVNALLLELEDKFLYERRPEISGPVGLSAEDLQNLTAVCRDYNVELIPLVQGLAHASYILKHAKYAHLREKKGKFVEFCPQLKGAYDVLFDLYEEVAAATKGTKYFHIGGDEAWLMGNCPRCKKALKKKSRFNLYEEWLNRCADKVRKLGRVPMVWDDMLIKDAADDWSKLPRDLFYVRWNYRANAAEKNRELVERYGKSGLKVIVAAAIQTDSPYVPNYFAEHFPNIEGFGKAAAAAGLTGILSTAWEDSGNHTETFWPGYAATGAVGWNSSEKIDYDFAVKFTRVFHGAGDAKLASVYKTLGDDAMATFQLFTAEEPYHAEKMYPLPALEVAAEGRRWRDKNAEQIQTARRLAAELRETKKVLSSAILSGRLENSYALEVLLASNRIMLARVDLFFSLRDAEIAVEDAAAAMKAGDKAAASKLLHDAGVAVYGALADGEEALGSLTAVWELTRMPQDMALLATPDAGYIHDDDNYRHLASKTRDLSYFLFVERRIGADKMAGKLLVGSQRLLATGKWPF